MSKNKELLKHILQGKKKLFDVITPIPELWIARDSIYFKNKETKECLTYSQIQERQRKPENRLKQLTVIRLNTTGVPVFHSETEANEWLNFKPDFDVTMKL